MQVRDLMTGAPETVDPDAHLHEVLIKMNQTGCRHIPVVEGDALVGIITDRDVRLAVNSPLVDIEADLTREAVLDGVSVADCMTTKPQCVTSDTPLREAADMLALNKFGAMPVVDDGKLTGMISYVDFLKHYAANG